MRNFWIWATALVLGGAPLAAALPDVGVPEGAPLEKRYIVGFFEAIPRDVRVGGTYHGGEVLAVDHDLVFAVVRTQSPILFEASVSTDDRVRYVEWDDPNYAVLSLVPNDSRYGDSGHWGSKKIGAEAAWDVTLGSTSVKVGMLDSGLNRNHEEYAGQSRVLQGFDFVNNDNDPDDSSGCSFHGTHTTGTAGATINNGKGIAGLSQHTILPVKAFYPSFFGCSGSTTAIVNGLKYIADQGSHLSSNSWGGGTSTAINDAIVYAHGKGTVHVAAAGNSGPCTNCVSEPWKSNSAITIVVASTTSSDGQSSFSSEGPQVDVAAPGSGILSTTSGTSGYSSLSGTSMATPHVTGTLALVKALNSGFGFADLDDCIKTTALDLGPGGKDDDFGYGRIRADQAVGCGGTPPPPSPACDDGVDNDGDGLIDYPDDPGCSSATDDDETNAPPPPPPGAVFSEDFDDASAPGWTVNSGTLWHLNTGCGSAHTGAYKVVWADSGSCTYNVGDTGLDWVKTPAIDLAGRTSATLSFWHWFETESYSGGAYDVLRVQRSCNDSTWTTLQQWDSRHANVLSWTKQTYDVGACAGGNLWIRWTADTIDGSFNNYDGWRFDTVEVTAS